MSARKWQPTSVSAARCLLLSSVLVWTGNANVTRAAEVLVGKLVAADQRIPMEDLKHADWNDLLAKYVDERGLVDYKTWKATTADLGRLDQYLERLSSVRVQDTTPRAVRLAYWINAYNAVTIRGILREYPTSSIRNHTAVLFGYNIWKDLKLQVDGRQFSLEQIEHDVLRKLGEPRIHFAIVCASLGCPKLRNEAYTDEAIERQLASNTRDFFADRSKFEVDLASKRVRVSPILKWFAEDFGTNQTERLAWIAGYAPPAARPLLSDDGVRLSYLGYDWGLNEPR